MVKSCALLPVSFRMQPMTSALSPEFVMAGFAPAIHAFGISFRKTWMPGIKPGMTGQKASPQLLKSLTP
jgi:hypothetical protein